MKSNKFQKINKKSSKKSVYKKYSFETRKKLISLVEDDNRTLASSAKELGICQTTARLIISTWRQEGRVFEKKTEKERRLRRQAKKEANALRKIKYQPLRAQIEEDGQRMEAPIITSSQRLTQGNENNQNEAMMEAVAQVQRAESPQAFPQHQPQPLITYKVVEIGGMYYIQPVYVMPNQLDWS